MLLLTCVFTCRGRKVLESRSIADDDRIDQLEKQVKDAKYVAEEADRKYDEVTQSCRMCFILQIPHPFSFLFYSLYFVNAM